MVQIDRYIVTDDDSNLEQIMQYFVSRPDRVFEGKVDAHRMVRRLRDFFGVPKPVLCFVSVQIQELRVP